MALSRCFNIEDVRRVAARRLPKGLFNFVDRATEDDLARDRNRQAFRDLTFLPRTLVDVAARSTETELFGKRHAMPLAVAPAGPAGLFWYRGELELAKAAARANVPFTLSTYSTTTMADIAATGATVWQQLYFWKDRALTYGIVDRARELGFGVLVVTVDTAVLGQREYLQRDRLMPPWGPTLASCAEMLLHPQWLAGVALRYLATGGLPRVVNMPQPGQDLTAEEIASRTSLCQSVTWDDIARLRERWPHKLLLKGIMREEEAERAFALGCDGVVVSNHGGRNLDSAASTLDALPRIVAAAGGKGSVLLDSGIRRGSDIAKALALGAHAVLAGRAPLYGVAAGGEAGAYHVLSLLQSELDRTMALTGCRSVAELTRDLIAEGRTETDHGA
ncbi:alpha-hydroxy acid oxidase [Bosea sp. NBC_00550]|uniref:alpha-hydroxy acid oxidase n=1 Tax=Bosea sp. NBC_00550 TaxID=2969621 RepID=UPI00222F87C7|nr:alpha-hydroxy acid oxidase [Bosea sp. NBC_00550]UZF94901.1 alpha-hydroxy-acid oxidizing protein [Bosea sp. NBC_00550]